jgi:hypothetical protein
MGGSEHPLEESVIKKKLFTAELPVSIPPVNQVMKDKKVNFPDFITKVLGEDTSNIAFEASVDTIYDEAVSFLMERLPNKLLTWNEVYIHLTKALKTNNGNVLNQVKPNLVL